MDSLQPFADREEIFCNVLSKLAYKDGWEFAYRPPFLTITLPIINSATGRAEWLTHRIPVTLSAFDTPERTMRWLFESIVNIERHEASEFFVVDGVAPYWPDHTIPYVHNEKTPRLITRIPKSRQRVMQEQAVIASMRFLDSAPVRGVPYYE